MTEDGIKDVCKGECMEDEVLPDMPLSILGDGEYTNTLYSRPNNTIYVTAHRDFIKRIEYLESMVEKLTAPNRETMR